MLAKKDSKATSKTKTTTAAKAKPAKKSPAKVAGKNSSTLIKAAETVGGIIGAVVGTAQSAITSANDILTPAKPAKAAAKKTASPKSASAAKKPTKSKVKK